MTDPHESMRFSRIETHAVLPSGKIITRSDSYPLGVGKDEYDRINTDAIRSFGPSVRIIGTPLAPPDAIIGANTPTQSSVIQDDEIIVIQITYDSEGELESDILGANRTLAGAGDRILNDVAKRLAASETQLTDSERTALLTIFINDEQLHLNDIILSEPNNISNERLKQIAVSVNTSYTIYIMAPGN